MGDDFQPLGEDELRAIFQTWDGTSSFSFFMFLFFFVCALFFSFFYVCCVVQRTATDICLWQSCRRVCASCGFRRLRRTLFTTDRDFEPWTR